MTENIVVYTFTAQQLSKDLLTISGGATIGLRGVVRTQEDNIIFTTGTKPTYNVIRWDSKIFRINTVSKTKETEFEVVATLDILSSIYYNSGTVSIQTQRHHSPTRCIQREWGGEQLSTWLEGIGLVYANLTIPIMFVCWTSTHNTLRNTNGDLIRYCCPVEIGGFSVTTTDWTTYERSVIVGGVTYKYPSLSEIMCNIEDVTGLDGTSILDVSYILVPPYVYNATTSKFKDLAGDDKDPNCQHDMDASSKYRFYQIDDVFFNLEYSLKLNPPQQITIPVSSTWGSHINRDYNLFVEGRKSMELVPKNNVISYWVTTYFDPSGPGYIISQDQNVTYVRGSPLPWIGDAYKTYQIQRKGTDEAKMFYDTIKGIANVGIGIGGAGMTGGMTAMSVPGSVASLGDPIANQMFTEEYVRKVPYGSGTPFGEISSLQYLRQINSSNHSPIGVEIITYSGEPTDPVNYGKNVGYPARGLDDISNGGLYQGIVSTITTTLNLTQDQINSLKDRITRGVRT